MPPNPVVLPVVAAVVVVPLVALVVDPLVVVDPAVVVLVPEPPAPPEVVVDVSPVPPPDPTGPTELVPTVVPDAPANPLGSRSSDVAHAPPMAKNAGPMSPSHRIRCIFCLCRFRGSPSGKMAASAQNGSPVRGLGRTHGGSSVKGARVVVERTEPTIESARPETLAHTH